MKTWQEDRGDETLALDWPLCEDSVVWEIGGFEGRWAGQIIEKYHPYIKIFEPQQWAVKKLEEKFGHLPNVSIQPFGLWPHTTVLRLWEHDTDGASVMRNDGRESEFCDFQDIYGNLRMEGDIDLCLMNIEGAEYTLLPYLIGLDMMEKFRYFWCQFHPGLVQFGEEKTARIFSGMSRTHNVLWDYYPTAVAWERKF